MNSILLKMKNLLHHAGLPILLCIFLQAQGQPLSKTIPGGRQQKKPGAIQKPFTGNIDSSYLRRTWVSPGGDTLRYRLLLPENFDSSRSYPFVLFLHGAGERGNDNAKQLVHGAKLFLDSAARKKYPAIVVFPQCDSLGYWSNVLIKTNDSTKKREFEFQEGGEPTAAMNLLLQWLPAFEKQFHLLPQQRYVMGLSMGGMGTFEIVRRKPGYFAAAVPICGGAHPKTASAMKQTNFWIFHGQMDDVVPYQFSERMMKAFSVLYVKAEVSLTLYEDANHNSWDKAFAEPDLLPWLFSKTPEK
jgi:predicted peptidase